MSFWSTLADGAQATRDRVSNSAQWLWNNASPATMAKAVVKSRVVKFVTNTSFHIIDELRALRQAIPTLTENPQAQVIMNNMGQLLVKDIVPLFMLHAFSNRMRELIHEQNLAGNPNSLFLTATWLACYLLLQDYNTRQQRVAGGDTTDLATRLGHTMMTDVMPYLFFQVGGTEMQKFLANQAAAEENATAQWLAYTSLSAVTRSAVTAHQIKRILPATVRDMVINAFAPSAFNSNKTTTPASLCIDHECNTQRRVKGMGRELGILIANDILIGGISYIPAIGSPLAFVLTILNNGRYIVRAVTPERCERHKYMQQEFVLAIGLTNEFCNWTMLELLGQYVGPLPMMYVRIVQHLLLQMHVNLAAHMYIPMVESKDATLVDVFNYYEGASRFLLDVQWAGLMKVVPKVLKAKPGEKPIISLSELANFIVRLLNSDLEKLEAISARDLEKVSPAKRKIKELMLPPMFRSSYDFMRDEVIATHWKDIRDGGLNIFNSIAHYERSRLVSTLACREELASALAMLLDYKFGIPTKLTKIILMLSKEEDFWKINQALKAYFDRHGPKQEGRLARNRENFLALPDDKVLEVMPTQTRVVGESSDKLIVDKPVSVQPVDTEQLIPTAEKPAVPTESLQRALQRPTTIAFFPDGLFSNSSQRRRRPKLNVDNLFGTRQQEEPAAIFQQ